MKKFKKAVSILLIMATVLSFFVSCDTAQVQGNNSQSGSTSSGKETVGYPNYNSGSSDFWSPIYLTTSAMKKESFFGGSGNNIKSGIAILPKSPDTVLVSTLDAGVIQSFDAATLWQNTSTGIYSLGIDAIATDPNNANFAIAVSTSSEKANGIYISKNGGQVWSYVETSPELIQNAEAELIFDKSSYSAQTKNSSVIYLRLSNPDKDGQSLLLRSDDSGVNFKVVKSIERDAKIAIHPTKSYVYLADSTGFYCSINRGFSFELIREGSFTDVLVSSASPDSVFLVTSQQTMLTSSDSGQSFSEEAISLPAGVKGISVSPLNVEYMVAFTNSKSSGVTVFYSVNGGSSWHKSAFYDNVHKMSQPSDKVFFAWSPSAASVVYAVVNNTIYKSVDSGALFTWSGNGDDSFDMNGAVSQNIHSPSYIAFAIDDITVALTTDGGSVWAIKSYGDYADRFSIKAVYPVTRSKLFMIAEDIKSGKYQLRVSQNGGEYFNPTGVECTSNTFFYSAPLDKNTLFASNMRSTDGGESWQTMVGCDYVLAHNPVSPNELFGVKGNSIVVSYDKGKKWQMLVNIGVPVLDLSYDYLQSAVYAATGKGLLKYSIKEGKLEECISSAFSNHFSENLVSLVEVDPLYPNVVYAAGKGDGYANESSVLISENGGKSWYVVSSNANNQSLASNYQGGIQPVDIFLSSNRELIVFSAKFGIHKFSAYNQE